MEINGWKISIKKLQQHHMCLSSSFWYICNQNFIYILTRFFTLLCVPLVLWKLLNNKFYGKYFMSANINFQRVDSPVAFEGAQIAIDCICNQNNSKTIFESGKLHNFHFGISTKKSSSSSIWFERDRKWIFSVSWLNYATKSMHIMPCVNCRHENVFNK